MTVDMWPGDTDPWNAGQPMPPSERAAPIVQPNLGPPLCQACGKPTQIDDIGLDFGRSGIYGQWDMQILCIRCTCAYTSTRWRPPLAPGPTPTPPLYYDVFKNASSW